MRHWKILLGSAAAVCLAAGILASSFRTGPVAAAAPSGPPAMPVPIASVIKKTIPVYLEYSARTESIREVSLQAKVAGYIQSQPAADGAGRSVVMIVGTPAICSSPVVKMRDARGPANCVR